MKTKKGQARAFCNTIEQKGFPLVRKYRGFLDGFSLISEEDPDLVLGMSFWDTKEAAEKYRLEGYPTIAELYQPFLEGAIHVRGYDVPYAASSFKARAAKAS
jgi:heme-degrading monooxygenase HmoA